MDAIVEEDLPPCSRRRAAATMDAPWERPNRASFVGRARCKPCFFAEPDLGSDNTSGASAFSTTDSQGAEFNNSDSIFIQKVIEIGPDFNSIQFNSILTYRARFQFNFNSNCWPNEGSHFRFNSISSTVSLRKYGEFPL